MTPSAASRVAIMGAGSWGTAFAEICADAGGEVRLWARDPDVADAITATRSHPRYLTQLRLHQQVTATADPAVALHGADLVVVAIPSHALREQLPAWASLLHEESVAVSLVKGISLDTRQRASEVVADCLSLPPSRVTVISGPNLAREVADRMPSATVIAGTDDQACARVQQACHRPWFRAYTNPDVVGVEVGGAVKNAIAIAVGMAHGMGYGDNTKATLITRGLAEMTRLGVALGGRPMTFSGLAGLGDLVATCSSPQSRNRSVGEALAGGRSLEEVVASMNMVAEGVRSSRAILDIAHEHDVDMPIVSHVVSVVHDGLAPAEMASSLMGRSPKPEFHGITETP